jgi:hypothetical protein
VLRDFGQVITWFAAGWTVGLLIQLAGGHVSSSTTEALIDVVAVMVVIAATLNWALGARSGVRW